MNGSAPGLPLPTRPGHVHCYLLPVDGGHMLVDTGLGLPDATERWEAELARLDDAAFRALFSKSPVKRIGRDRFVRNVLIGIGNADDASLAPVAERLLDDASPLVRGAAVWALSQLVERERFNALARKAMDSEADQSVRDEWRQTSVVMPRAGGGWSHV